MSRTRAWTQVLMTVALVQAGALTVFAADWGDLKGRFVVDGEVPQPNPVAVTKDQFCIDKKLLDESVVVSDEGGLANVLVFIRLGRRDKIDIHPDYDSQLTEPVVLDNVGCQFVPHITLLRTGQPLALKNSDPVGHNTNVGIFNQIIASGTETPTKIDRASPLPMPVACNIHPFMKGYVVVQDHPYMSVSGEDGHFEIKKVPAGERQFIFWHEAVGVLKKLKIGEGTAGRRGDLKLTITAGEALDLGDIQVPSALLKSGD